MLIISVFFVAIALPAAPANDLFANRLLLTGTNVTVTGNNYGAGIEPGEDAGSGTALVYKTVWYAWTAPADGVVYFSGSTAVWNFYMSIRAFRGSAVNALTLAPQTPDQGVPVTAGETLAIQVGSIYYPVWGGGGGEGAFTLTLALQVAGPTSTNDAFADRLEMTLPAYHFEGSIYGATVEPGEPLPVGATQTLWWKLVAPEAGVLVLWPSTPQFSGTWRVYEGADLGALRPLPSIKGLRYRLEAGHEYAMQLATGVVPGGAVTLDVRFFPLTNDFFAGSTRFEGTNFTYVGNMTLATREAGEPNPGYSNTIWISWAAPCTGRARFINTVVEGVQTTWVYTGPTLSLLQPVRVVGMDNSRWDFLAVEGTVYHFQISGTADECYLNLELFPELPPVNDPFAAARSLVGPGVNSSPNQEWNSISGATSEWGEPEHLDGLPFKSLWWQWTAPVHGLARFQSERSLATNVVLAAYRGPSLPALSLLGKGTNTVAFAVNGGDLYFIAAAVPTDATGDVLLSGGISWHSSASRAVPGNLLREPSWEGTGILNAQYWGRAGGVGGAVNERGGCDGTTWPTLGTGARIWQDFGTVPGQIHAIRFAMRANSTYVGDGSGDGRVRVLWDNQEIGVAVLPEAQAGFWNWAELTATANQATSRVTFVNLGRNIEMDAFSVVAQTQAPEIVRQPVSASVMAGGTVAFVVGATGWAPLTYWWTWNGQPYAVRSEPVLVLESVTTNLAGIFAVVVSNAFGTVTSAPVTLVVEAPTQPVILWQPYGDSVGPGGYFSLSVVAAGTPPLNYQWFKDGQPLPGETNRILAFDAVQAADAGIYTVRVDNLAGTVWSLGARLVVTEPAAGGGRVLFANGLTSFSSLDAPVFDVDTVTPLNGSNYMAQLYAGPTLELLRPVSAPSPFRSGFGAGYFYSRIVTLPNVPPGATAVLQVRAWDANKGSSYEEARALGGRFGKSELWVQTVGGGSQPPTPLGGLQSFSLQAGRPQFISGRITFVERRPGGVVVWSHHGETGFRYLIEKSVHGFEWRPYLVITNHGPEELFTDAASSASRVVFYRSRILD